MSFKAGDAQLRSKALNQAAKAVPKSCAPVDGGMKSQNEPGKSTDAFGVPAFQRREGSALAGEAQARTDFGMILNQAANEGDER